MCLFSWINQRVQRLRWYDISCVKLASAAFALMIAKIWPPLLALEWQSYLTITLMASAPVIYRMLKREP